MSDEIKAGDIIQAFDTTSETGEVFAFWRHPFIYTDDQAKWITEKRQHGFEFRVLQVAHYAPPGVAMVAMTPERIEMLRELIIKAYGFCAAKYITGPNGPARKWADGDIAKIFPELDKTHDEAKS